jgi:hypothetical protein
MDQQFGADCSGSLETCEDPLICAAFHQDTVNLPHQCLYLCHGMVDPTCSENYGGVCVGLLSDTPAWVCLPVEDAERL